MQIHTGCCFATGQILSCKNWLADFVQQIMPMPRLWRSSPRAQSQFHSSTVELNHILTPSKCHLSWWTASAYIWLFIQPISALTRCKPTLLFRMVSSSCADSLTPWCNFTRSKRRTGLDLPYGVPFSSFGGVLSSFSPWPTMYTVWQQWQCSMGAFLWHRRTYKSLAACRIFCLVRAWHDFFTAIVIYGNFEGRRRDHATSVRVLALVFLLAPCKVTESCSDDGQQMTAYWSGVLLQLPAGWITIFPIWRTRDVGVNKQRDLVGIPGSP